jgi:hypothetical protein
MQTAFPSNYFEIYAYDPNNNLTSKTDRKGRTVSFCILPQTSPCPKFLFGLTVRAAGTSIADTADGFHVACQHLTTDRAIVAQVVSQSGFSQPAHIVVSKTVGPGGSDQDHPAVFIPAEPVHQWAQLSCDVELDRPFAMVLPNAGAHLPHRYNVAVSLFQERLILLLLTRIR